MGYCRLIIAIFLTIDTGMASQQLHHIDYWIFYDLGVNKIRIMLCILMYILSCEANIVICIYLTKIPSTCSFRALVASKLTARGRGQPQVTLDLLFAVGGCLPPRD